MTDPTPEHRLPTPRTPGSYRIAMVCSGNICRSPTAEVVLVSRLDDAGLGDLVDVASCGIGDWHVGKPMDPRSAAALTRAGYDASRHRAQQLSDAWFVDYDLLLAMDAGHLRDLRSAGVAAGRVLMLRDFDPAEPGADVPDPYYGDPDGFEEVLAMVERASGVLVTSLAGLLGGRLAGR